METLTSGIKAAHLTGSNLNIEIITVAFMYPALLGGIPYVGPAFDSAKEDILKFYPRLNVSQSFVLDQNVRSGCVEWLSVYENLLASYYYSHRRHSDRKIDLTVFLMSGCDDVVGVAQFATQLDKLIISSVGSVPSLADKEKWPTWITTSSISMGTFKKVYAALIRNFNWSNLVIVCDINSNSFFLSLAGLVHETFAASLLNQVNLMHFEASSPAMDYTGLMRNISSLSRVVLYFGHSNHLQKLLTAAAKLNMTNGEYIYVAFIPFRHPSVGSFQWVQSNISESVEEKESFNSVLLIEPSQSAENQTESPSSNWRNMSKVIYNYTYGSNELVSPHPASTYSAMMILAEVIEELRQGNSSELHSGRQIAKHFMDRAFLPKTGPIHINEFGERVPVMTLTQSDPDTGKVTVVMEQDTENFQLRMVKRPSWPGVWPVPDKPRCGFRGDAPECQMTLVQTNLSREYGAGLGVAIIVIFLASVAFLVRLARAHANGDEKTWWILSADDISILQIDCIKYQGHNQSRNLESDRVFNVTD